MADDITTDTTPGTPFPLGATCHPDGVNFSVYSKRAKELELLLFDAVDARRPSRVIALDRKRNRTAYYWHVFVRGLRPGQLYGLRARGPFEPKRGLRFDGQKILLDPYGRGVEVGPNYDRGAASRPGDNTAYAMKSVVVDPRTYDWEGDQPLCRPFNQTVIYELHVGGFTRHPSSGVAPEIRGTYAGLVEKIPYLRDLGITAVELLPIFQFDAQDAPLGLTNYWGYSPVSFFAPHLGYSSRGNALGAIDEFRDLVKALHRAGIEVILDVVYNHTAEGTDAGPTFCFRGLDDSDYYLLDPKSGAYLDFTGTGNTVNGNNAIVRRLILESLRYWVREMHVDGFRFDLASILARDEAGHPMANPPILWTIESDPILAGTKLIAEAWDAGGLYQVGIFPGDRWQEWNGRFRDDVRSFVKGDRGAVWNLAQRIVASPDIYGHKGRAPEHSIHFVTCHDGFTLNDLVSYDRKHNLANGENDRDGSDHNLSWNCGVEGPTDDRRVESLRQRQICNFLTITLLSLGTPMLLMGDEMRRTQHGNNNAYCQDNEIGWLDWTLLDAHRDLHRFVRRLIRFRQTVDVIHADHGLTLTELLDTAVIRWHGVKLDQPDWSDQSHSLALTATSLSGEYQMHVMLNAYWEPLEFELPPVGGDGWRQVIDTARSSPNDFRDPDEAPVVLGTCRVGPRSIFLLVGLTGRE